LGGGRGGLGASLKAIRWYGKVGGLEFKNMQCR
jgi:hypothetical protein